MAKLRVFAKPGKVVFLCKPTKEAKKIKRKRSANGWKA